MEAIEGKQIIAGTLSAAGTESFPATDRNNGQLLPFVFYKATAEEVDLAVEAAISAFAISRNKSGAEKANFLDALISEINAISEELVLMACKETALPEARIWGEKDRTINQIRLFSTLLKEGHWVDARIETSNPLRLPIPKPDTRSMQRPLGPVAVFGASNFPLAFSVAGGDTISALAAGCPVIFKAHPAHPATCELVGKAIVKAIEVSDMPPGLFSMLHGDGPVVGTMLVRHPGISAVAFTGSFKAGKAIFDIAVSRPVPIPVYAEMGSTNPVFVLPEAMKQRGEAIATGYAAALTLGVGQFCTNPGLLIHLDVEPKHPFHSSLKNAFANTKGGIMLAENIAEAYSSGITQRQGIEGLDVMAEGQRTDMAAQQQPILFTTTIDNYDQHPELEEELFGPSGIVIEAGSKADLVLFAKGLTGHLTATVHGTDEELPEYKDLLDILEQKVGRLVINGFPTGVEVNHAMVHGGPYPACTDSRSTSVGSAAIYRFTRPVCYQSFPQTLLPDELKNANSLNINRLVNGTTINTPI